MNNYTINNKIFTLMFSSFHFLFFVQTHAVKGRYRFHWVTCLVFQHVYMYMFRNRTLFCICLVLNVYETRLISIHNFYSVPLAFKTCVLSSFAVSDRLRQV